MLRFSAKLEKIVTTKAEIALAGQIQNRSSQNIILFVKDALDQELKAEHNFDCEKFLDESC